ncbi:MAG: hypothetical protein IKW83_03295 [Muribaculaceae bacterium]|nr:hypothetical protein [Muribaculaceae bacterium]
MKKFNFVTLAFAILVPMLFASCGNNDELVGNYEVDKKDITKMVGQLPGGAELGLKLSLNKGDSALLAFVVNGDLMIPELESSVKVSFDVEYNGKWDYSGITKQIKLEMNEGEFKNIKIESDDELTQAFMKADDAENKLKEILMKDPQFKDLKNIFKEPGALNVKEIQDDGFIVEGNDGKGDIKFNKVK